MADRMKVAIEQACQMFMYPIAKFLLARGFKYPDFAAVAKLAFVQAADELEPTVSAIASKTGMPRRDVLRFKDVVPINVNELFYARKRPSAVLSRWFQDKDYLEDGGRPRAIEFSGPDGFEDLVKRVEPGWDPQECYERLIEVSAISRTSTGRIYPSARYYIPPSDEPTAMFHYGLSLRDLAVTLSRNLGQDKVKVLEAASYSVPLDLDELPVVRRVARLQGVALLEAFDDWLTAQTSHLPSKHQVDRVRTSLYVLYYEDDLGAVQPEAED